MPNTPPSSDWERYFGRDAQRRQGPVAMFVTLTLVLGFIAVMVVGANFGFGRYREYTVAQSLTATPLWAQYYAEQTATAEAKAATAVPTAQPTISVVTAGNVRSEPRIAPETIVGQVAVGDTVVVLESRDVDGGTWHRVRINGDAAREGWVSATLLAPPAP